MLAQQAGEIGGDGNHSRRSRLGRAAAQSPIDDKATMGHVHLADPQPECLRRSETTRARTWISAQYLGRKWPRRRITSAVVKRSIRPRTASAGAARPVSSG
jgi:hypothetical protein